MQKGRLNFFLLYILILGLLPYAAFSQDTFSIVAIDTVTGEVGSAGASCVDLTKTDLEPGFISQVLPGLGAINTQSFYLPLNQQHAAEQMQLGKTPQQILEWLIENDAQNNPHIRQYGMVAFVNGKCEAGAFTGKACMNWKGQIIGPNYAIQGNILLNDTVLARMEYNFLNTEGSLADKLMAALQGANIPGADKRCLADGTSSHFAFIKVAKPNDNANELYLDIGVKTAIGTSTEPIDSLQVLFNEWKLSR